MIVKFILKMIKISDESAVITKEVMDAGGVDGCCSVFILWC